MVVFIYIVDRTGVTLYSYAVTARATPRNRPGKLINHAIFELFRFRTLYCMIFAVCENVGHTLPRLINNGWSNRTVSVYEVHRCIMYIGMTSL